MKYTNKDGEYGENYNVEFVHGETGERKAVRLFVIGSMQYTPYQRELSLGKAARKRVEELEQSGFDAGHILPPTPYSPQAILY